MHRHYRSGPRREFDAEVSLVLGGDAIPLDAVDIGPSGVYVATEVLPEEGDEFDLLFSLPDGGSPLEVRGRVARVETRRRTPTGVEMRPGVGIVFGALPHAARTRIARYAGGLIA